jgi:hypothetical protein
VSGTGGEVRKVLLSGDAKHRFFRVVTLAGSVTNWLPGLSAFDLRPARLTAQAGGLLAEGVRVTGAGISSEDLVIARFEFDPESQSLRLAHYQVVPNVGVYTDRFFARNVPLYPPVSSGGNAIPDYTWHALSGTNITINLGLEVGHVFNFGLRNQSREYTLEVLGPDGPLLSPFNGAPNMFIVEDGIPVLKTGLHQIRIRPRAAPAGTSVSCQFYFANNNCTTLTRVGNGDYVYAALRQNTHDYAKYWMALKLGQVVRLPAPPLGVGFEVVDSHSRVLARITGLDLIFDVPADDIYFLFVYKVLATDGDLSYRRAVSIGN